MDQLLSPGQAARLHWPEYAMEAGCLGAFMLSACSFASLLFHPGSPLSSLPLLERRALMGCAMGLTNVALIYSPWGKRSGAHMNPAVTLSFLWLGRVPKWDAAFYVAAQFTGGMAGVALASAFLPQWVAHPSVHYVVTRPGEFGVSTAVLAEAMISFGMMSMVLRVSSHARLSRWTGFCAGLLVALYITFEAPLSGMSMNPARSFGSAVAARDWTALWVYFFAPVLGMVAAAVASARRTGCAKLHHANRARCIFCGKPAGA